VRGQDGVLFEIGGMPDHLHAVLQIGPDMAVAEMVRLIKAD
jgi:REP element-mobilizing transposase RayT